MTDITIPDEVVEAICKRLAAASVSRVEARAAILAALQAWPGARGANQIDGVVTPIILPLPTKETDA